MDYSERETAPIWQLVSHICRLSNECNILHKKIEVRDKQKEGLHFTTAFENELNHKVAYLGLLTVKTILGFVHVLEMESGLGCAPCVVDINKRGVHSSSYIKN